MALASAGLLVWCRPATTSFSEAALGDCSRWNSLAIMVERPPVDTRVPGADQRCNFTRPRVAFYAYWPIQSQLLHASNGPAVELRQGFVQICSHLSVQEQKSYNSSK
jgi:hypothetical protein